MLTYYDAHTKHFIFVRSDVNVILRKVKFPFALKSHKERIGHSIRTSPLRPCYDQTKLNLTCDFSKRSEYIRVSFGSYVTVLAYTPTYVPSAATYYESGMKANKIVYIYITYKTARNNTNSRS